MSGAQRQIRSEKFIERSTGEGKKEGAGVDDGARTRDSQNHNLELYQLSYIHRNNLNNTTESATGSYRQRVIPAAASFLAGNLKIPETNTWSDAPSCCRCLFRPGKREGRNQLKENGLSGVRKRMGFPVSIAVIDSCP